MEVGLVLQIFPESVDVVLFCKRLLCWRLLILTLIALRLIVELRILQEVPIGGC
jgi:hypothetical protein